MEFSNFRIKKYLLDLCLKKKFHKIFDFLSSLDIKIHHYEPCFDYDLNLFYEICKSGNSILINKFIDCINIDYNNMLIIKYNELYDLNNAINNTVNKYNIDFIISLSSFCIKPGCYCNICLGGIYHFYGSKTFYNHKYCKNPVMVAVETNNINIIKILLDAGHCIPKCLLYRCIKEKKISTYIIDLLLKRGATLDTTFMNTNANTILEYSIQRNEMNITHIIMKHYIKNNLDYDYKHLLLIAKNDNMKNVINHYHNIKTGCILKLILYTEKKNVYLPPEMIDYFINILYNIV